MNKDLKQYSNLDDNQIVVTLERLASRIEVRFPSSGLYKLCTHLKSIADQAKKRSGLIAKRLYTLRLLIALGIASLIGISVAPYFVLRHSQTEVTFLEFIQVAEPGLNLVILIGAAIVFLVTIENRIKRKRALAALHELRSVAHIIDMHQLTKDPERLRKDAKVTSVSPKLNMTAVELSRYLDYCCELLSLNGKIAALYIQYFEDPVAISAANDIETLCTGLSRKIWQKIIILDEHREGILEQIGSRKAEASRR